MPARPLTRRELEVAALVAEGETNRQIARRLFIGERTAEYHVEQIRNKLGFHARSQIAAWTVAERQASQGAAVVAKAAPGTGQPQRLQVRPRAAIAALVLVVAMIGTGLAIESSLRVSQLPVAKSLGTVMEIDAATGLLKASSAPISAQASDLAIGEGSIWAVSYDAKTLTRVNPRNMASVGSYGVSAPPVGVAVGGGFVWIATSFGDKSFQQFDPKTNHFGQPLSLESGVAPQGIAYGQGAVWVTDKNNNVVYRVDPSTQLVTARVHVGAGPESITVGASAIWVANAVDATVSRIDPSSSRVVATIGLRGAPTAIAAGQDAIWVVSESASLVIRIDPTTNAHVEIPIASPTGVVTSHSAVWIAQGAAGKVARIDPGSNSIAASILVGGTVDGIAADGQSVWVITHAA